MNHTKENATVAEDVSVIALFTLKKLRMIKIGESDLKMLRGISTGAALFTLIVALTMLFSVIQLKTIDPLDNKALNAIKEQYDRDPDNALIAEQVRSLDLMARKAYFASRRQVETGAYLLVAGAVVFLLCQRLIAESKKTLPSVPGEKQDQLTYNTRYARYLAGTVAFLTIAAIASSFILRSTLPDLSGKSTAKAEKIKENKGTIVAGSDSFQPDAVNYPFFRGQDGRATAGGTGYPVNWDGESGTNIKWKITVPKNGQSSPVIWGDKLFITGSDGNTCEVYCINKNSGKIEWTAPASGLEGEPEAPPETDQETGLAASSPATDGKSVCAIFANGNLVCLDLDGNRKWAKNIGKPVNIYGYSSSLVIYNGIVIVQFDSDEKVSLMGFDPETGELKYETIRRGRPVWSSPVIATFDGQPQVIINGNPEVTAFDPLTGNELWTVQCLTGDVAPSLAVNSKMVYAVTDYAMLAAIKPGTGASIVWNDNMFTPNVSSPAANDNFLFISTGNGDVACYDAMKGDTLWTRYVMDQFYASPVIAEDKVYMLDRSGVMHILKAGPVYEVIAESPIGEPADCTPAFSEKAVFIRGKNNLYCISEN
ncbi:MAG: PQQ-binding-like beta-propeller repeat protein [Bacteroidales bacterium]|nr:PQQ-binding-like beta-propeller repeat protein [Bacteroidales bacterium]